MTKADSVETLSQDSKTEVLLLALLALQVSDRENRMLDGPKTPKTEQLLANAGMTYREIAKVMNKSPDAVRMALTRLNKAGEGRATSSGAVIRTDKE